MAIFTNNSKNNSTHNNQSLNSVSWKRRIRHGIEPTIEGMADLTFEDPMLWEDDEAIKDKRFNELTNQTWTNQSPS